MRDVSIQVSDLNDPAATHGVGSADKLWGGFGSFIHDRVLGALGVQFAAESPGLLH